MGTIHYRCHSNNLKKPNPLRRGNSILVYFLMGLKIIQTNRKKRNDLKIPNIFLVFDWY